ncbi:MAG: FAD-dependent oxidoreductase [Planctomycetes bacterium]|nr:FAD-dependent oxidoreductase [Planctomycetota bacterium]
MGRQKDIIIIGGGIIGVSTAYYLAMQGRSVTLIEKDDIGAGSSHGNAGLIANGFSIPMAAPGVPGQGLKWLLDSTSPFSIKPRLDLNLISWLWKFRGACNEKQVRRSIPILLSLGRGSFDLFDELFTKEDVDFGYDHKGRLILFTSEESFEKWGADVALIGEFGVDVSLLDADGVRRIEPNVLPAVTHGIYCEAYAHVNPARFVHEMARLAKNNGVQIKTGTMVSGFETSGRRISSIITTEGAFIPDQVVLAAGAWSPVIANGLKLRLPMQPAKGYSLSYKRPSTCPRLPLSLAERKVAVTPMGEMLRFTSTLELAGFDPSINQRRLAAIRQSVNEYLPGMEELEEEVVWSGYRPATPDDLPIIGRSGMYQNLILATGHGTLGMTHGLITGNLVSQIIAGEPPSIDLTPLRADRF